MRRLAQRALWWSAWQRPGWTATSCLFHLVLVGVLVLLQPAPESARLGLRVRLVEEPRETAPAIASPPVPFQPTRPTAAVRRTAQQLASTRVVPARVDVRGEPSAPEASPAPSGPVPAALSIPEPSAGRGPGVDGGTRRLDEDEVARGGRGGAPLEAGDTGSSPAKETSERHSGLFLVSSLGDGTGLAGSGNGAGNGSGGKDLGTGHGGTGERNGAGAGRGGGGAASLGGRGGNGSGLSDLLGAIRHQIEQAKVYPDTARREGMQGTVELRFRIAGDGSVEAIEIVRSSGHRLLDEVSAQTVRRAGPFPSLAGWIRIPLSYRLDR